MHGRLRTVHRPLPGTLMAELGDSPGVGALQKFAGLTPQKISAGMPFFVSEPRHEPYRTFGNKRGRCVGIVTQYCEDNSTGPGGRDDQRDLQAHNKGTREPL
jgi:hypothetical protein